VERIVWGAEFETVVFSSRMPCHIEGAVCIECGDFADLGCVRDFAANVLRQFGRVDALVNNAGEMATRDLSFAETTAEEMMRSYAVNTVAPVVLAQCFLPGMQQRGWGAIVNVSSGQGAMNEMGPLRLAYRCSKVRPSIFVIFCSNFFPLRRR
jgi:NAD(P)-dependent dehydrogenase (short-subunit alcohol dehydrogenase family)